MRTRLSNGFTLLELLIVVAVVGVLAAVLVSSVGAARERALYAAAIARLHDLAQQVQACAVGGDFGATGGWPSDGGVNRPPLGCEDINWPDSAHNPFGSTFDYSNATRVRGVPAGKRWVGITFWGKNNVNMGRMNFGPGLVRWDSGPWGGGGNVAYSLALESP